MRDKYRAFVSSAYIDLKDHRRCVIEQLRKAGFFVDPMEDWTADADEPQYFSQDRVVGCDLCILLVAFRRGFVPDGHTKSITQLEYETAIAEGIDVLPFILSEEATWPDEYDELDVDPEIRRWREDLRKQHGVQFFNLDPSSIDVTPALTRWVTQQNRVKFNQPRPRAENILLQQVEAEVVSRLKQSLHNQIFINLGKEDRPEEVERPWDYKVKIQNRTDEPINRTTTIQQVFNRSDINGRLLILGQPGSGKTTTLLDLAKFLVKKARDPNEPIPVLVNLSSWGSKQKSISEWLAEALKDNYGVSLNLGRKLIAEQKLVPLLDGLDEVEGQQQRACVDALNQWIAGNTADNSPGQLAICSRIEEYEQLDTPLMLNGAICLLELSDEQLETYLKSIERSHLWFYLDQNNRLKNLVRAPLFLSMLVVSDLEAVEKMQTFSKAEDVQFHLLDIFVRSRLERSGSYTKQQMQAWLVWIAKQMENASETEFLIEKIQPSAFSIPKSMHRYRLIVRLISGLILGLMFGGLNYWLISRRIFVLIFGLTFGLIFGLTFGLSIELGDGKIFGLGDDLNMIIPIERIAFSWKRAKEGLIIGLSIGLMFGLSVGLMFGLGKGLRYGLSYGLIQGLSYGLIGGLVLGLGFALSFWLIGGLIIEEIDRKISVNQGILKSLQFGLFRMLIVGPIVGLMSGLIGGLIGGKFEGVKAGINGSLIGGLIAGINGGLGACLQHVSLRLVLCRNGFIPWNYARFLNHCTDQILLQRVGGRFRFIHKTVQEHLAAMSFEKP